MKIAFVNSSYQLGGAETVVRQLHEACLQRGDESYLYIAEGKQIPHLPGVKPLYPRLLSRLWHSRFHGITEAIFPHTALTERKFLSIADTAPDLVHVHNFHGKYASIQALSQLSQKTKLLWTFHRMWGITGGCDQNLGCPRYLTTCGNCPQVGVWPIGPIDDTAEQLQLKKDLLHPKSITVVAPSAGMKKLIETSPIGANWDVRLIYNGVNPNQFSADRKTSNDFRQSLGINPSDICIALTNRNFEEPLKGGQLVREALNAIAGPGITIILAGGNTERFRESLSPVFTVIDLGYVSDRKKIADVYEAADIFLFASAYENFPCVILEAMSAECCVVSTPTEGVIEQIQSGVTGILCSESTANSLAESLQNTLALGRERIREFGKAARQSVQQNFSEEKMLSEHFKLYDSLVH